MDYVRMTAVVVVLLLSNHYAVKEAVAVIPWNYDDQSDYGPSNWPSLFPNYCNGSQQSPIDIQTAAAIPSTTYTNLIFTGYNYNQTVLTQEFTLFDSGHSVQVNLNSKLIRATGASLMNGNYTLEQFHFHWGTTTCNQGSEHRIDGKAYPLEIHFVHYNSDKYSSVSEAAGSNDETAIAVFAVMVDVADGSTSANFDALINTIAGVPDEGDTMLVSPFAIQSLLPCTKSKVYTYQGSLTTPNCSQVVIWNVFETPIYITIPQLNQFRTVKADDGEYLVENYRPTQPLNRRIVTWYNVLAPSDVTSCFAGQSVSNTECMASPLP